MNETEQLTVITITTFPYDDDAVAVVADRLSCSPVEEDVRQSTVRHGFNLLSS